MKNIFLIGLLVSFFLSSCGPADFVDSRGVSHGHYEIRLSFVSPVDSRAVFPNWIEFYRVYEDGSVSIIPEFYLSGCDKGPMGYKVNLPEGKYQIVTEHVMEFSGDDTRPFKMDRFITVGKDKKKNVFMFYSGEKRKVQSDDPSLIVSDPSHPIVNLEFNPLSFKGELSERETSSRCFITINGGPEAEWRNKEDIGWRRFMSLPANYLDSFSLRYGEGQVPLGYEKFDTPPPEILKTFRRPKDGWPSILKIEMRVENKAGVLEAWTNQPFQFYYQVDSVQYLNRNFKYQECIPR